MFELGFLSVLLLCTLSWGHICSLYPPQRGPLSVSQPGDDSCYRRTPYCGGIPFDGKKTSFLAGQVVDLIVQQNLNHWYPEKPGFIDVAYAEDPNSNNWETLKVIDDFPAFEMVVQTNFTLRVRLPNTPTSHGVLRYRYQSNNPMENDHGTLFYNCADIELIGGAEEAEAILPIEEEPITEEHSCQSPSAWEAFAIENTALGTVDHHIYYDFNAKFVRWERVGALESRTTSTLVLITNYTSEIEYLIDPTAEKCEKYGPDAMYPWGYGMGGMTFDGVHVEGDRKLLTWYNPTNGMRWSATSDCLPFMHYGEHSTSVFYGFKVGPISPSVFKQPTYCK